MREPLLESVLTLVGDAMTRMTGYLERGTLVVQKGTSSECRGFPCMPHSKGVAMTQPMGPSKIDEQIFICIFVDMPIPACENRGIICEKVVRYICWTH